MTRDEYLGELHVRLVVVNDAEKYAIRQRRKFEQLLNQASKEFPGIELDVMMPDFEESHESA